MTQTMSNNINEKYKLYELVNPIDDSVFYIGITINEKNRYASHFSCNKKEFGRNAYKTKIIYSLKKQSLRPVMNILFDNLSKEEAMNLEIDMIEKMRILGYPLTNISDGGNCHSEETIKRIKATSRKRIVSEETKIKMRKAKQNVRMPIKLYIKGKLIQEFESIKSVIKYGYKKSSVRSFLKSNKENRKGELWLFS